MDRIVAEGQIVTLYGSSGERICIWEDFDGNGFFVEYVGDFGEMGFDAGQLRCVDGRYKFQYGEPSSEEETASTEEELLSPREKAFASAQMFVDQLLEDYELTPIPRPLNIFGAAANINPAEQHLGLVLRVADWLMEDGDA